MTSLRTSPPPARWRRPAHVALAGLGGGLLASMPLLAWADAGWLAPLAASLSAAAAAAWVVARKPAVPDSAGQSAAQEASLRDPRTGMFHRAAFLALAERDWMRAGRYGGAVALLLVEVDRMRSMTDRSGPGVADALLGGLGAQVLASLRGADLLSRFDDAQLAVFLPHADPTGALDVADRIRENVQKLSLPGLPDAARFTASIGVAVLQPQHQPLSALVADAQQALQTARQGGGNCLRMAPPDSPHTAADGRWVGDNSTRPSRGKGG